MTIKEYMKNNLLCLDGGMGTLLQEGGLAPGELPERRNITHPEQIIAIHRAYYEAGTNVVSTNTFGANPLKLSPAELEAVVTAAVENARIARDTAAVAGKKFIALDIGPTGRLLKPLGDLDFEDAVAAFATVVRLGVQLGVDLIFIETMNDSYETKAALLAAKENSTLPVFVSNAYGADGKLMTGATPAAMVAMLEGLGADAIGANCSLGPAQLLPVARELLANASVPVLLKPNAGLPRAVNGNTVYDITPEGFADELSLAMEMGVRIVGGCCGTTPAHIAALASKLQTKKPLPLVKKELTVVSSYTHAVTFGDSPLLIGERINPTGKKRFKQALTEGDMNYILREGLGEQEAGAHILDVNVGLPGIDEAALLQQAVCELQTVLDLPLQLDTADSVAMEQALRRYNGKAMLNSVNGKAESMRAVFPLVKKYGGVVVALTLDENGIPATAEGRVAIAERILSTAATYGIDKRDIVFDTLTMTVSTDKNAAKTTLSALSRIRRELGCHTVLGVSNVSFGLPRRELINSAFFAAALENGLSAAILNPYSTDMLRVYHTWRTLHGLDENCGDYIAYAEALGEAPAAVPTPTASVKAAGDTAKGLQHAIVKGMREAAASITAARLHETPPLTLIESEIIPALNTVGIGFEEKTVYLPQLLMSAEAARAAFDVIKEHMAAKSDAAPQKGSIILATVAGDIHDIGKNIVRLLLENYGFAVQDLGKDVAPEAILAAAKRANARLVGLSALMTTTVPAMEKTVALLKEQLPDCRVMVGGAVLTADYAAQIGADAYGKDAMEAVRYAETVFAEQ